MLGQALILLPFYMTGIDNVYLFNNILVFLAYLSGGIAVYMLARELAGDYSSSVLAGIIFILAPVKETNLPHLNLLFISLSIFALCFFFRYLGSQRLQDLVFFSLFYFAQALFDLSYFFLLSVFIPFYILIYLAVTRKFHLKSLFLLALSGLISILAVLLIYFPYLRNPLGLENPYRFFDMECLLESSYLYTGGFFAIDAVNPVYCQMFLGFCASFLTAFYFYAKSSSFLSKSLAVLLFSALTVPYIIYSSVSAQADVMRFWMDISVASLLIILIAMAFLHRKNMSGTHMVVLIAVIMGFIFLFQGIYSFIPFETNLLRFLSRYFSIFSRIRGIKIHYFFLVFWIILAVIGIRRLKKSCPRLLFFLAAGLLILENFPSGRPVGRLAGFSYNNRETYSLLENYPDYYGVLELPHEGGGFREIIYVLNTMFHNKQIYNGIFGVNNNDALNIYRRGYFSGINRISSDITDREITEYLRKKGINIILVHKSGFVWRPSQSYIWGRLVNSFNKSLGSGLIDECIISDDAIIALLKPAREGREFVYQLPYRYFYKFKNIILELHSEEDNNCISLSINRIKVLDRELDKGLNFLEIPVESLALGYKENYLSFSSSSEIIVKNMEAY